jgi:rod shape determining protein RodA
LDRRLLSHFNWSLLLVTLVLDAIGLLNLYSAVHFDDSAQLAPLFMSQAAFAAVGIVGMLLMTSLDYRVYERLAYSMYAVGILLLGLVLLVGRTVAGSKRWLNFGLFSLQPSELCKLLFVIALAKYFHDDARVGGYRLRDLGRPFLLALPVLLLIFVSPDLGTTAFFLFLFLLIALSVRLRWQSVALLAAVGLLALPLLYEFVLSDYQRDRVVTLLDPNHDPRGKGYQTLQARYAIGAGRLLGNGYLQGMQTHQGFIPKNHTDFIITVLAEEWGFAGCLVLLSLYYILMMLGLNIASQSKERFGAILATGIVCIFFLQICINLGAVLGVIPVTGVTLPLMSYGGSSVLTLHLGIGLLLNISMRRYMF